MFLLYESACSALRLSLTYLYFNGAFTVVSLSLKCRLKCLHCIFKAVLRNRRNDIRNIIYRLISISTHSMCHNLCYINSLASDQINGNWIAIDISKASRQFNLLQRWEVILLRDNVKDDSSSSTHPNVDSPYW